MTEPRDHKYHTLDALRGVAAIVVMLGHVKLFADPNLDFYGSYLAVDLFFLLSGFVLARAYGDRLAGGLGVTRFMAYRLIRLWPMIFLGVAIGGVQIALLPSAFDDFNGAGDLVGTTLLNAGFLPSVPGWHFAMFPVNDPEWSLFFELIVNLAFALGLWRLRGRALGGLLVAFGLLELGLCVHYRALNTGFAGLQYPQGCVRVGFSFFLGVALYQTRERWGALVPRLGWIWPLPVAAALFFVPGAGWARAAFDAAFVGLLSPLLVMMGARTEPGPRGRAVAIWLGEISYPLYAIHFPLVRALSAACQGRPALYPYAGVALAIVLLAVTAPLARVYDAPMRRLLTRLAGSLLDAPRARAAA